jgi:hypothetical protein
MTALRIFSYLPNPRIWKATITGRLCDVEIEVRGASPRELSQWLWDFDARPIAEVPRESWSVRNALVEAASPIKSYIRQTRFSRRILSVPFRLRSVQTVARAFSSQTALCVLLHGLEQNAFRFTVATYTKVRAWTRFWMQVSSSLVTARSISWH